MFNADVKMCQCIGQLSATDDDNSGIPVGLSIVLLTSQFPTGLLKESKSQTSLCQPSSRLIASRQKSSHITSSHPQSLDAPTSTLYKRFMPKQMQDFVYRFSKLNYTRFQSLPEMVDSQDQRETGPENQSDRLEFPSYETQCLYFLYSRATEPQNCSCLPHIMSTAQFTNEIVFRIFLVLINNPSGLAIDIENLPCPSYRHSLLIEAFNG